MANKNVCKSCGRVLTSINKLYVCANSQCKFEGLLKVSLGNDFKNIVEAQYVST